MPTICPMPTLFARRQTDSWAFTMTAKAHKLNAAQSAAAAAAAAAPALWSLASLSLQAQIG